MSLITPVVQRWIDEGRRDPDSLWARAALELPWFRKWDRVLDWDPPTFKWFAGGQTNLCWNALDRHVLEGQGGRAALVYINERGERSVSTYAQLLHQVRRVAAALRALGIGKGDRITIYMPPCPESIALMLAAVLILYGTREDEPFYLDAALVLSALSFVSTIAAARYQADGRPF